MLKIFHVMFIPNKWNERILRALCVEKLFIRQISVIYCNQLVDIACVYHAVDLTIL